MTDTVRTAFERITSLIPDDGSKDGSKDVQQLAAKLVDNAVALVQGAYTSGYHNAVKDITDQLLAEEQAGVEMSPQRVLAALRAAKPVIPPVYS